MSEITVRAARVADAATIAVFNLRMAWETQSLRLNPSTVERGVRGVFAEPSRGNYYVAEQRGRVVGCLMVTREWSDWRDGDMWWIQSVYVDVDARKRGVFKSMHAFVRAAAIHANAVALRLYVDRQNDLAKSTYAALGFVATHYDVMHQTL